MDPAAPVSGNRILPALKIDFDKKTAYQNQIMSKVRDNRLGDEKHKAITVSENTRIFNRGISYLKSEEERLL